MVKTNQEADKDYVIPDFIPYLENAVKEALKPASVYNYDGLIIGYVGKSPSHMMEEEKTNFFLYKIPSLILSKLGWNNIRIKHLHWKESHKI